MDVGGECRSGESEQRRRAVVAQLEERQLCIEREKKDGEVRDERLSVTCFF